MKRISNIIKSLCTFLIFYYSNYLQYIPVMLFNIKNITPKIRVLLSAFSTVICLFILYFMYRDELRKEWKIFSKKKLECLNTGFIFWILGFIIMLSSNILISVVFKGTGAGNEKIVQKMITALPLVMFIDAGIMAPFNEEITFRKAFKNLFNNHKVLCVLLSGLVFGFLHVYGTANSLVDFLYIIPYGSFGACFMIAYYKTNTFFTSYIFHTLHNVLLIGISIMI